MLHRLTSYIARNKLLGHADRLLVAVSGGVDSMTLLHLLRAAGYRVGVAHCNFGLRGKASDGDEQLVRSGCSTKNIPLFVKRFDTAGYVGRQGISIQMAARELRYAWFEEVAAAHGFDKIAVAHNANDEVETFFLNLVRGTGLRGLTGMAPAQGKVVRPLLFAPRSEILQYAQEHGVRFREDASNSQVKYARNRIRLNVLTELTKINPSLLTTMQGNMEHLKAAQRLVLGMVDDLQKKACCQRGGKLHVKISELPTGQVAFWLFELLREHGFSGATVGDIAAALHGESGKIFYSPTHQLLKDRDELIVAPKGGEKPEDGTPGMEDVAAAEIDEKGLHGQRVEAGCTALSFEVINATSAPLNQGSSVALLDYNALQFPLTLRRWRAGDRFAPLGMKGEKKLSDFFTDCKLNLFEKRALLLLCSANGDVAWVVGLRMDNRYRVTKSTRRMLKVVAEKR
jgi:tRNA(Ile)-lysidine synthase